MLKQNKFISSINSYFKISDRKSTFKKEIIGGISTFLAIMYILAVNPSIIANSSGIESINNIDGALFLGTALISFLGTFLMGIFANVPITLAPGMGLNAFFAYTVASQSGFGLNYYEALICVIVSGVLYCLIAITPARTKINEYMPKNFKIMIGAMIGFFLAYVALANIGIVNHGSPISEIGSNFSNLNPQYPIVIVGTIALVIGVILHYCRVKYSIIITTIITIIMLLIVWGFNNNFTNNITSNAFSLKNYNFDSFGLVFKNIFKSEPWAKVFVNPVSYIAIFTFLYVDFFDTSSTFISIGRQSKLLKKTKSTNPDLWIKRANYIDATSTICGAFLLTSSATSVAESMSAVNAGAKTGFSALITSLLFLLSILLWPIMGPFMPINGFQPVTGHAIFITGLLMISQLKEFDWKKYLDIPVLAISIIFGMLGYSISIGLSWGLFFYVIINELNYFIRLFKKENNLVYFDKQTRIILYILLMCSITFIIFDICTKTKVFNY